jgi:hypothetical protein
MSKIELPLYRATQERAANEKLFAEQPNDTQLTEVTELNERPEIIMERAKTRRVELFKKLFISRAFKMVDSPLFLKIANYAPIVGDVTLLAGAVRGKEGTRKLSAGERLNYVAAVTMAVMGYISLYQGNLTAAGIEQTITYTLLNIDTIPVALKTSAKALENKNPKISHLLESTANFVEQKREALARLGELFTQDSIQTLGLSINEV